MRTSVKLVISAVLVVTAAATLVESGSNHGGRRIWDVLVTNSESDPVPVRVLGDADNPARQPFQARMQIVLPDAQCCDNAFVSVPAGKRLVVEYASAWSSAPGDQVFVYEVGTRLNGQSGHTQHLLPVSQRVFDGNTSAIAGQQVRLYADPGPNTVLLRASRSGGDCATPLAGCGEATVFMTVSGHLVDLP